jgi:hypothetical protein
MNLACVEGEVHVGERPDAWKNFVDIPHFQQSFFCHKSHPITFKNNAHVSKVSAFALFQGIERAALP